jgi:hypothetical protein
MVADLSLDSGKIWGQEAGTAEMAAWFQLMQIPYRRAGRSRGSGRFRLPDMQFAFKPMLIAEWVTAAPGFPPSRE